MNRFCYFDVKVGLYHCLSFKFGLFKALTTSHWTLVLNTGYIVRPTPTPQTTLSPESELGEPHHWLIAFGCSLGGILLVAVLIIACRSTALKRIKQWIKDKVRPPRLSQQETTEDTNPLNIRRQNFNVLDETTRIDYAIDTHNETDEEDYNVHDTQAKRHVDQPDAALVPSDAAASRRVTFNPPADHLAIPDRHRYSEQSHSCTLPSQSYTIPDTVCRKESSLSFTSWQSMSSINDTVDSLPKPTLDSAEQVQLIVCFVFNSITALGLAVLKLASRFLD